VSVRTFASVQAGEELPECHRMVTAPDVKAYADASGDQNPLHQDNAFARGVGFSGIIAHGMFTMGCLASCVSDWAGSSGAVVDLSAQFRAPVFMGDEIVAGGRVRRLDRDERSVTIDTWVRCERDGVTEWPIKRGEAVVRLR
jgi:acyl dehydratase